MATEKSDNSEPSLTDSLQQLSGDALLACLALPAVPTLVDLASPVECSNEQRKRGLFNELLGGDIRRLRLDLSIRPQHYPADMRHAIEKCIRNEPLTEADEQQLNQAVILLLTATKKEPPKPSLPLPATSERLEDRPVGGDGLAAFWWIR